MRAVTALVIEGTTMRTCALCRFETEVDDIVVIGPGGRCVCLRCYQRETDSALAMPQDLKKDLIAALAAVEAA